VASKHTSLNPARDQRLADGCIHLVKPSDGELLVAGPDLGPTLHHHVPGILFVGLRQNWDDLRYEHRPRPPCSATAVQRRLVRRLGDLRAGRRTGMARVRDGPGHRRSASERARLTNLMTPGHDGRDARRPTRGPSRPGGTGGGNITSTLPSRSVNPVRGLPADRRLLPPPSWVQRLYDNRR
jgi:hypothetical protein